MNNSDIVPLRALRDNYIWIVRCGHYAAAVDPADAVPVLDYLQRERLTLTAILNTHHHADHTAGNAELLRHFDVPVYGPSDKRIATVTHPVGEGNYFDIGECEIGLTVLEIPGHTRTHIAFYGEGVLFCGDTLFACGCGRLFEGTPKQMHDSLSRLARLPSSTRVYCGHEYTSDNLRFARTLEPNNLVLSEWEEEVRTQCKHRMPTLPSTIGREKAGNPFLRCSEPTVAAAAAHWATHALTGAIEVFASLREWKNNFR